MIPNTTEAGSRVARMASKAALLACFIVLVQPMALYAQSDLEMASGHVTAAQEALAAHDYWRASNEFSKAAALSKNPDIARKATRIAFSYDFNKDARASAERWRELDPESDEALLYLALTQLRDSDIRASRKTFTTLLEGGEDPPDQRLISLVTTTGYS